MSEAQTNFIQTFFNFFIPSILRPFFIMFSGAELSVTKLVPKTQGILHWEKQLG